MASIRGSLPYFLSLTSSQRSLYTQWMSGAVLFGLGAFSSLAFHLTLEFFHLSFHTPFNCHLLLILLVPRHTEPLQKSSTFLSSSFPHMSSILPLSVPSYCSSSCCLGPSPSQFHFSRPAYCEVTILIAILPTLFNDWIVELIMSLN